MSNLPLPPAAGVEEILRLFQGRRGSQRTECRRLVIVSGPATAYRGSTLNVSRLGALLEINDVRFLPAETTASLMEVAQRVADVLPGGLRIIFRRAGITMHASVVRVARHPTGSTAVLGCAFATPLTRRQCNAIGIAFDPKGDAAAAPSADPATESL